MATFLAKAGADLGGGYVHLSNATNVQLQISGSNEKMGQNMV